LQAVSFPVALMSKSCKLIVVMVGGVLILGKKYQLRDYSCALAIIAGLFVFQSESSKSGSSSFFGIGVLLLSLAFDSLSSNYNEKMVSVNKRVLPDTILMQLCQSAHSFADAMCWRCLRRPISLLAS
jgi:drug/metabolite transporter (DMT)-like permease